MVGQLPPPNQRLEREDLGDPRSQERMGLSSGQRGTLGATPPKAWGMAPWGTEGKEGGRGALRTEEPEGQPRAEPVLLPAARLGACCFLLGIAQLRSSPTSGAPAPAARGARGLARLSGSPPPPARWLLGRLSASVPLTIPPCNSSTTGQRPPSLDGRHGWLVPAGLK